jgi:hypothetical protein
MTELSGEAVADQFAADPPERSRPAGRDMAALPIFRGIDEHFTRRLL